MIRGRTADGARTVRTDRYRLIVPPSSAGDGSYHRCVELYDYHFPQGEGRNLAEALPAIVDELSAYLP